mgnify:FL=1
MEDGSWDFYEKRKYNSADIQKWGKKTIDLKLPPKWHQQSLRIRIDSYRIVDLIIIITLFTIKLVLYFKIYKHVSRTLDISTLNETTNRRKIKRVSKINLLVSFSFDQPIIVIYVRHPFSIYGQTFSKSYSKHLFMYSLQYSLFYPLVSNCKTSSLRAAFSFQELSICLMKWFRICQLFVDVDKLRSVQVHHSQHVPGHVQQGECIRIVVLHKVFFNI